MQSTGQASHGHALLHLGTLAASDHTLIAEVSLKQVSARVAKLLLNSLGEEPILGVGISKQVNSQFTQQQMAAMAGTT
jgi:hypothetical protein